MPFSDIIKFWERAKAGERKSFTYDEIDKSFRINSGKGIMIHYLETIQKDLDRRGAVIMKHNYLDNYELVNGYALIDTDFRLSQLTRKCTNFLVLCERQQSLMQFIR